MTSHGTARPDTGPARRVHHSTGLQCRSIFGRGGDDTVGGDGTCLKGELQAPVDMLVVIHNLGLLFVVDFCLRVKTLDSSP